MRLDNIWSDGIVIQQNKKVRITGSATLNADVRVRLVRDRDGFIAGRKQVKAGDDGRFVCELPALQASHDTYTLTLSEPSDKVLVRDILIGELWLASGQSNMAFDTISSLDGRKLMERAVTDKVRFMLSQGTDGQPGGTVELPATPMTDVPSGGWKKADRPDEVEHVSCIALTFALELYERLQIPVGILCAAVGGTAIEAWLPRDVAERDGKLKKHLEKTGRYVPVDHFNQAGARNYTQMSGLFNEKIAPLTCLNIRGVIWQQGESSANDEKEARYYRHAFDKLIRSWNKRFRDSHQPFVFAHIAAQNYQFGPYGVPYINEAFDDVWRQSKNFAIQVPIYDIPLDWKITDGPDASHPIHPIVKVPIGERMAALVLGQVYGKSECSSLSLAETKTKRNRTILTFEGVGSGLRAKHGSTLRGFTVCGKDGRHIEAAAAITGPDTIEVYNEHVEEPAGVTYAFSTFNQSANLVNSYGMPAIPFRTGRTGEQYCNPRLWMSCDFDSVWVNCFEWALGGAEFKPLWSASGLFGSRRVKLMLDQQTKSEGESSLRIDYEPEADTGYYFGVSPAVNHIGYYHQLQNYDFLTFDLHNPDNREKLFVGVNIKTFDGQNYLLPVEEHGLYRANVTIVPESGFKRFKVSLKTFLGCYLAEERKDPADVSDVIEMQWTFRDPAAGTLYMDNISAGWEKSETRSTGKGNR